ncbi:hypothetical protein AYK21_05420 [Thermoplasmatales archaeon SG8-52-2]|nr:MAG: hypothetical protein AYK21_05420 [Thermoplasmatales archaeon SG8-52-2]
MRLKLVIGLSLFLSIFIIPSISADPTVIIDNYTLYPEVFMPGDSGILTLTITNAETTNTVQTTSTSGSSSTVKTDTAAATIKNIWIVSATDGTHKVKATKNYEDVGNLAPASSIDINFKIIAEENITQGLYFPIARVNVETYDDVRFPIPIKVSNASVDLLLTDVPSRISKSGSTLVTVTAVNSRENSVDGVTIIPDSNDGLKFTPNSVFVGTLEADASSEASFSIKPEDVGDYNISFTVQFKNGDNVHSEEKSYSISVVETLDVAPILTSIPSSIEKGKSTRVSLEVYNAKTQSITGVIVTPITEAKVSPTQYFIGSMDPDDVFSASFDVSSEHLEYGNYSLGFKVSFKQDNEYYETPIVTSTISIVPRTNSASEGSLLLVLGAVVIVILLFLIFGFYYNKRRSTK